MIKGAQLHVYPSEFKGGAVDSAALNFGAPEMALIASLTSDRVGSGAHGRGIEIVRQRGSIAVDCNKLVVWDSGGPIKMCARVKRRRDSGDCTRKSVTKISHRRITGTRYQEHQRRVRRIPLGTRIDPTGAQREYACRTIGSAPAIQPRAPGSSCSQI